jgi:CysZ protein
MIGFFRALGYPFRGFAFFAGHRELWKYAAAAFAVNFVLFAICAALFFACLDDLVAWILPENSWGRSATGCLVTIAAVSLGLFLFTILGKPVAGPFLDAMTERMLVLLGEPPPPPRGFLRTVGRSIVNLTLKLIFFGGIQVALLLLLVTPLGFFYPFLSGFLTVLFLGFEVMDYPLDARRVPVAARFAWLVAHLRPTLAIGAFLFLVFWIPFVGILALPLVVCGANLLAHDIDVARSKR